MSAELLRRAAGILREHAEKAADKLTDGAPWTVEAFPVFEDDDPCSGVVARRNNLTSYITGEALTDYQANYIALMHPPVALALADLLDFAAEEIEANVPGFNWLHLYEPQFAVARAVLREPEETPDA